MGISVELPVEVQEWVRRKVESGAFASPEEFIKAELERAWMEEKIEEAMDEPASRLIAEDWEQARCRLEANLSREQ